MNKQKAQKQMNKLQSEMDKLKQIIDKSDVSVKRWRADISEGYYSLNMHNGGVQDLPEWGIP